jgi:hypothetical protein
MHERLLISQLIDLHEVIRVDLLVFIRVVQSEEIPVLGLHISPDVEYQEQMKKQLKVYTFGLQILHLLLEEVHDPRIQRMVPHIANLPKISYLQRFQILLVQ